MWGNGTEKGKRVGFVNDLRVWMVGRDRGIDSGQFDMVH